MSTIELRPYQTQAIEELRAAYRTHNGALFQLGTGGGKTFTASTIVKGAANKGNSVWWLTHRRELAGQASRTFYSLNIPHGVVQSGSVSDHTAIVQVASIQTIVRRIDKLPAPDLIVFDEAHHIGAAQWQKIFDSFPNAKKLGLTATPWRLDGQGLGKWFTEMVEGPTVRELIDNGSLCDFKLYAPATPDLSGIKNIGGDYQKGALAKAMDKPTIVGNAIQHWKKLCHGKRAVVFAAGIENSKSIVAQFNEEGIPAEHVDGTMGVDERDAILKRFEKGETLILSNVDLFGEGFDVPAIEAVIMLRPTKSLSLYLQQVGRALRPMAGKSHAVILDHAGNSIQHGLPDDEREWSLEDREKRKKSDPLDVPVKQCGECFFVYRPAPKCPQCGFTPPVQVRKLETIDGELEEVKRAERVAKREKHMEEGRAETLEDFMQIARERGYKSGWARKRFQIRQSQRARAA